MMTSFVRSCKSSKAYISISRVLFYSTETIIIQQKQVPKKNDSLYSRISPVGNPDASVIPILEQWEKEGKPISFKRLIVIIKSLRKFNRYAHALQLSEWMSKRTSKLKQPGVAVHLDLVSRVQGVEQAEKYFNSLPEEIKNFQIYGALLNCYASTRSLEKAEATFEKMKQMGTMTTLSYNSMLNLYKKTGNIKKVEEIYQEMLETGVNCDNPTYHIRLNAYAAKSDLEGMEKVLRKMEENSALTIDWYAYVIASRGYLKSGDPEKAYEMLKKADDLTEQKSKVTSRESLFGMYADLGKKEDVYRIWNSYNTKRRKVYNHGYSAIIHALVKLDDLDGAEKVLSEWESEDLTFDFRIPNMLINAYCKKGILGKAEAYVERVMGMGKQPPASTWVLFVGGYVRRNEMGKAVEMLRKCVESEDKRGCRLDHESFVKCVEYLKEKGDFEFVEEIVGMFGDRIQVPRAHDDESLGDEKYDFHGIKERRR